jgi:3-isopropylmalate/(R)-2-methylmalate dehydratase large subunit
MGQTIAEKILAAHGGLEAVRAGDVVVAAVDFAMLHDARASNALKMIFRPWTLEERADCAAAVMRLKTALVLGSHYSPPPQHRSRETCISDMRALFADRYRYRSCDDVE